MSTTNEETPNEDAFPGDPNQPMPLIHRLFFDHLQTKDNGIKLIEIFDSGGRFQLFLGFYFVSSIGLLISWNFF